MASDPFSFELHHRDQGTHARVGRFLTPHGPVDTPSFMPVGTQGTVKGVPLDLLQATGAQMVLANTYHLALRPGEDVVRDLGGLHGMTGWQGPMLTDSGGFQLFSLAQMTKVTEEGATFRSHIDGSKVELSPERSVEIQEALGSDVAMVLDHVVKLPNEPEVIREACDRSVRWARRCQDAHRRDDQAQFAIVQGGLNEKLRVECAEQLVAMNFPGYAIGGLSVGEPPAEMYRVLDFTCPVLPEDRPRYLMGVGTPTDLLEAVARGVDLFDCVIPTRNGRNGLAYTDQGILRMRNLCHQRDDRPLDPDCPGPASGYSRGYIRHLFRAGEMLGPIILSMHNLSYFQWLLRRARQAITENRYDTFRQERLAAWATKEPDPAE